MKKYFIKDTGEEIRFGEMITTRKKLEDGEISLTCMASQKLMDMLVEHGFVEEREVPERQWIPQDIINSLYLAIEQLQNKVDMLQRNTGRQYNALNSKINSLKKTIDNGK